MADCRFETYVNEHKLICDEGLGEIRLQTRQIVLHRDLRMKILSRYGKTKIRQVTAETAEI